MTGVTMLWRQAQTRYVSLARRERILVAVAIVLVPALIVNSLWADPQWARVSAQSKQLQAQENTLNTLQSQLQSLQQQLNGDPDAPQRQELKVLEQEPLIVFLHGCLTESLL